MACPVTEIALLPMKVEAATGKPSAHTLASIHDNFATVAKQNGFMAGFIGLQVEDDSQIYHLLDWDSIVSHQSFMDKPIHDTVMAQLDDLLRADPPFYHVYLHLPLHAHQPTTLMQLLQPVPALTWILTLYFPSTISQDEIVTFEGNWAQYCSEVVAEAVGCVSVASGWAVEELGKGDMMGGKAKGFCVLINWDSQENEAAFLKSSDAAFKKLSSSIETIEGYHVELKTQEV